MCKTQQACGRPQPRCPCRLAALAVADEGAGNAGPSRRRPLSPEGELSASSSGEGEHIHARCATTVALCIVMSSGGNTCVC